MDEPKKKKILVIEDDAMLSEMVSEKLVAEGYDVSRAHDGEEGLQKIFDERPDLVILDVYMPKKDGIAVLKELHEKEPGNDVPVIVLSDSNDSANIANAISNRAAAYFVKSDQQLQRIIELIKERLG